VAVFELLENVNLPGSFGGITVPAAPVTVIVEIILSGAGLKDSVSGDGPEKLVFEGGHLSTRSLLTFYLVDQKYLMNCNYVIYSRIVEVVLQTVLMAPQVFPTRNYVRYIGAASSQNKSLTKK
jgi:hypothetical protein